MRDDGGQRAVVTGLRAALALAAGWLLFGDWSAPGLSQLLSGVSGNWLLLTGLAQVGALVAALLLGRLRGAVRTLPMLCWAGISLLLLVHLLAAAFDDRPLDDYAAQKVAAWFVLCGPALLLGMALGREAHLHGRAPLAGKGARGGAALSAGRCFLLLTLPLGAMCVAALVVDPRYLTVASYWNPMVFFGWLVLPVHQALACCVAKQALFAAALITQCERRTRLRAPYLALLGGLLGLVLLTGARGYAVAAIAAVAAVMLFGRRRIGAVLVTAAIGAVLFQTLAPNLVQERLNPALAVQSASYSEREEAWQGAIDAWKQSPLVGQGPGGFSTFMSWHGRAYAHNLALEFASELGTIGLLLFVAMLLAAGAQVVRAWRRGQQLNVVQAFAVGFFVFSLLGAMVIGDWIRNAFLFLAIGMVHASLRHPARVRAPVRAPVWTPVRMPVRTPVRIPLAAPAPLPLRGQQPFVTQVPVRAPAPPAVVLQPLAPAPRPAARMRRSGPP